MARQSPDSLWTMRKVQGLLSGKPGVSLEARLMQEPDAIHCSSQVATPSPGILSIGSSLLTRQLGGVMDQQAGAWVGGVIRRHSFEGIDNGTLFFAHILLEVTQFPEAIDNDQARLYHLH